jgi:hypothetical protein
MLEANLGGIAVKEIRQINCLWSNKKEIPRKILLKKRLNCLEMTIDTEMNRTNGSDIRDERELEAHYGMRNTLKLAS